VELKKPYQPPYPPQKLEYASPAETSSNKYKSISCGVTTLV